MAHEPDQLAYELVRPVVLFGRSAAERELPVPLEAQIFPTDLSLNVIYLPTASNRLPLHIVGSRGWDTRQTLD